MSYRRPIRKQSQRLKELPKLQQEKVKLQKRYGSVITRDRFGKSVSGMTAADIDQIKTYIDQVFDSVFETGDWQEQQLSPRIVAVCCMGSIWCLSVGFESWSKARKFNKWISQVDAKTGEARSALSVLRMGKRTGFPVECKVWGPNPQVIGVLVERDLQQAAA